MPDSFANRHRTPTDPAVTVFEITPDDGVDLIRATRVWLTGTTATGIRGLA